MRCQKNFIFRCPRCNEVMLIAENKPFIPIIWFAKRERYEGDVAICRKCKFRVSGSVLNFYFTKWVRENGLFVDTFI